MPAETIKVVLVEGSAQYRQLLLDFLAETGFEVIGLSSNELVTAEFLQQEQPDVVALSVGGNDDLEEMSFLGNLRLADPNLGIIAIGPAGVDWTVLALDAGADDYLFYGYYPAVLAAKVRALARRVRRSRK